jgi:multiple sugar transport system permease protein
MTATSAETLPRATGERAGRPGPNRRRRTGWAGYAFLVPWFAGLALFTLGPMAFSLYLSFTDYSLLQSPHWVGLTNYRVMFSDDPRYLHSVGVTLRYVVTAVPLKLAVALAVALLLNRKRRGTGLYRAAYYVPSLLGTSVAVALAWRMMYGDSGTVQTLLGKVGVDAPDFIHNPTWALWTLVLLAVWQFGAPMVIFLAGLKQIPADLYDAAAVDGASWWARFRKVTVPMLSPVLFFNLVLETIHSFQAFTPAYIVSGGTGGPADATLFYTLYLYEKGFGDFQFGYASAMAWVLLAVVGIVTAILFRLSRLWVFYGDEG